MATMARKACLFVVLSLLTASRHSNAFASSFGSFHSTKSSQRATAAPRSPAFAEQGTALQQHQQRDDQPVVVGGGGGGQRNNQTALHVAAADALLPAPPQKTFFDRIKSVIPTATERKKLIPLAVMYFCILFNYTILRSVKDVLLVTAPHSGAEVIPFMKTYVNLPAAIAFAAIYAKLTDSMELKNVFYACIVPFLVFFGCFGSIVYPNTDVLHPHGIVNIIAAKLPANFAAPLSILRNWSFALFYVMAEMWGSVVAALLFWGFANEVTTVPEAKKYYPLFGLGANVALILAGQFMAWVTRREGALAVGGDAFAATLGSYMAAVVASGGIILGTYKYMQDRVIPTLESTKKAEEAPIKKKVKMTMRESFSFLAKSPYIRNLAILVMSSGLCLNLVEVSWKAKLKQLFPDPTSYSSFMGHFQSVTGAVTLGMMLMGRSIFANFGWGTAALVTPFMVGVTGLVFFALNVLPVSPIAAALGTTPLMLAVLVGAAQNVMSKSSKYSLFDPCKEMAYIPLDQESKTKGKAAIDVVGVPLGKSGSSLIQQMLIFGTGSLTASSPYLAAILMGVVYLWFRSSNSLAKQFDAAMTKEGEVPS